MSDASLISIPLGGGLDESTDDAFVSATRMRVCQNVVFPDANTCTKRQGVTALATLANLRKLAKHGDEVLAIDGLAAWAWSPKANALVKRGAMPPCIARQIEMGGGSPNLPALTVGAPPHIAPISYSPPLTALAEGNGYRIALWNDGFSAIASIYDVASQVFVRAAELLNIQISTTTAAGGAVQPRAFIMGTTGFALYYNVVTGNLVGRTIDLTNPTAGWSVETVLVASIAGAGHKALFDAYPIPSASTFAVIFCDLAAGPAFGYVFNAALAQVHAGALLAGIGPITACAVRPVAADNLFMWSIAADPGGVTNVYVGCKSLDLGTLVLAGASTATPPKSVAAMSLERKYESGAGNTSIFILAYSNQIIEPGTTVGQERYQTSTLLVSAGSAVSAAIDTSYALQLMSRVFCVSLNGANQYMWLGMGSDQSIQPTSILFRYAGNDPGFIGGELPIWVPVATLTPDYAASIGSGGLSFPVPSAQDVTFPGDTGETVYTVAGTFVAQANSTATAMFEIDFASPQLWQSVELGRATYFACGTPMVYDGVTLTEAGFLHAPPQPSATRATGSGSVPINPNLQYVLCYAQQDAAGNVHRSEPSAPITLNMTAAGNVTLSIVPYKATYRQQNLGGGFAASQQTHPVTIEVYRNTVATGGAYQLLAVLPNLMQSGLVTYVDVSEDTAISNPTAVPPTGNPVLYTQNGGVPAVGWPSLSALAVHSDRIFGCDADGITQYYSTPLEAGTAPRMADAFTLTWPEGPITASWSLEGRHHAATAKKIFFVYGDGPNDNGSSSDFSSPAIWQSDLGVVDARSFVLCQPGVIFLSEKGLYLETRAGEFQRIDRVRRTLAAAGNVVTSMAANDVHGSVRIALGGAAAPVLHYDYWHDRWSTLLYAAPIVSSLFAAGTWWATGTPGGGSPTLYQETSTSNRDGTTWVTATLVTGWAEVAGKQASSRVQRIMLLASTASPHGIVMQTARDYQTPAFDADSGVWSDADIAAMGFEQMRHIPTSQKCMGMSTSITDAAPTTLGVGTGAGAIYKSLMLRTRARRGEWKRTSGGQQR